MSAIRLPLLCAFAGGCLSSAVLFGLWRADTAAAVAVPTRQQQVTHPPELAKTSNSPRSTELLAEAPLPRPPAPDAKGEASTSKDAADLGNAEPTPAGSAVSDVLTDLEAAYRQRLIAAARAEAAEAATELERSSPPARPASALAQPEAPRAVTAPVAATAAPVAVAPIAAAPVAVVPIAAAPVVVAPIAPAAPTRVAQNDSRPVDVHYGDVNNTYITNVRQGDVYVMQQQIAMMQYMQLLGASSAVGHVAPAHVARATLAQGAPSPQYRQFPSTLTNPDNPWGFNFAPPNLVH
jgi:hypothetical protein